MFSKKKPAMDEVAGKLVIDGKVRDISVKELCLSNSLSQKALVSVLVKKGIITPEELLKEIEQFKNEQQKQDVNTLTGT
jgi:hypothetical protein